MPPAKRFKIFIIVIICIHLYFQPLREARRRIQHTHTAPIHFRRTSTDEKYSRDFNTKINFFSFTFARLGEKPKTRATGTRKFSFSLIFLWAFLGRMSHSRREEFPLAFPYAVTKLCNERANVLRLEWNQLRAGFNSSSLLCSSCRKQRLLEQQPATGI